MKKVSIKTLLICSIMVILTMSVMAQQPSVHPKKKVFQDVGNWKVTSPGDVKLKHFRPFRAVYDRTYKQGGGPNAGDLRRDRVIISAEETGWDGKKAIAISLIDSGIAKHSDTNARILNMFVDSNDLSMLFEIGPIPGKAKDYYIGRIEKEEILLNQVKTGEQKLESRKVPTNKPGFGPNAWVVASMNLSKGMKIKLNPVYSPRFNSLTSATHGHIVRQETFTDKSGKTYKSWVLETSRNLATPRVSHIHLTDQPPYFLGRETVNLDTGKRTKYVWLNNKQSFKY